jgi:hypothetical protein
VGDDIIEKAICIKHSFHNDTRTSQRDQQLTNHWYANGLCLYLFLVQFVHPEKLYSPPEAAKVDNTSNLHFLLPEKPLFQLPSWSVDMHSDKNPNISNLRAQITRMAIGPYCE